MGFMKPRTIYQSKKSHVYINQCHAKGRKTNLYAVRKDGSYAMGEYLGGICWDGGWRKYVFEPLGDYKTKWDSSCMDGISEFLKEINKKHRDKKKRVYIERTANIL